MSETVLPLTSTPYTRERWISREQTDRVRYVLHESSRDGFVSYEREIPESEAITLAVQMGVSK